MTNACRKDFPLLMAQDIAYLDNAATAQRPQCVLDAVRRFYCEQNANPLRGLYPLSIAATDAYENAREAVRRFLNAKSTAEIVFTRNTTEGLNLVAYSYGLSHIRAGDEVVVSILEHHSDLLPWQMVCRQTGASLKFLDCEPDGSLDLNKAEALITDRTKLVAVTHVSNVIGRVNPIRQLADMAHKHGAVLVVDGAQSTPHIPVDVQALDADFLAFSGHKVYGPMGIGVLYGKRALLGGRGVRGAAPQVRGRHRQRRRRGGAPRRHRLCAVRGLRGHAPAGAGPDAADAGGHGGHAPHPRHRLG